MHELDVDYLLQCNFALPEASWKLDCVNHLQTLEHIGFQAAHEHLAVIRKNFLDQPATPYKRFEGN